MVLSIYLMVVCLCTYFVAPYCGYSDYVRNVALWLGIAFFWIADVCYTKKIKALEKAIKELQQAK